ncbi:hypothetical protein MUO79_02950 [Candidatus Bathyarchaeota archaeon]|nr:hypothetical protein [Candidatus Bathyarchaeota archaeon]
MTVTARYYNPRVPLTIQPATGGSTDPPSGTYWYDLGTQLDVYTNPGENYVFDHWQLGSEYHAENPIHITMNTNYNLQPYFTYVGPPVHWLTVDAYDGYYWNPLYPNIYIDGNWAGYGYASVQVTEDWHSVWVDELVWNDYIGWYDYLSYFTDGYGNGAYRQVYSDTWITAVYYPW